MKEKGTVKKQGKYALSIALQVISTVMPVIFGGGALYFSDKTVVVTTEDATGMAAYAEVKHPLFYICLGLTVVGVILLLATKTVLANFMQKAIEENEYDEFGNSKKKSFKNLTRKEREAMDLQKMADMERLLSTTILKKITVRGSENPEQDLNQMIGIEPVKEKMQEMIARMRYEQANLAAEGKPKKGKKDEPTPLANSMSGRHMVFYGDPGTGKTTVARIVAGFLYKYGYIKENKCIEIDGNFLKAGADSATKTKYLCQKAYDGVLFIDEAYSIIDGAGEFGKEAVATLIKEMEDNRDRFIVILAGYKNDIKRLLDSNEGFKSRIKEYLEFPDYSIDEMGQIFQMMGATQKIEITPAAMENAKIRFEREKRLSSFGNGRTVRNVLDEAIDKHALNFGSGKLANVGINGWEAEGQPPVDNRRRLCGIDVLTSPNKAVL